MPDNRLDYDQLARRYDQRYVEHDYGGIERTLQTVVDGRGRVLEVGCGTGHWLEVVGSWGHAVHGIDASTEMLQVARRRLEGGWLSQGRAEVLPFMKDSFDVVLAINALHHFAAPATFAGEAARVLAPGGVVVTMGLDPSQGADEWYVYDYFSETLEADRERYPASSAIKGWLREAGLQDASTVLAQRMSRAVEARPYIERGAAAKHVTSQLALLSQEAYAEGMGRVWRDLRRAEAQGSALMLRADLHIYATSASVPE